MKPRRKDPGWLKPIVIIITLTAIVAAVAIYLQEKDRAERLEGLEQRRRQLIG